MTEEVRNIAWTLILGINHTNSTKSWIVIFRSVESLYMVLYTAHIYKKIYEVSN